MIRSLLAAVLLSTAPCALAANPGIDSISPSALVSSPSPQTVTVTGHDFAPGATVTAGYRPAPNASATILPILHDVTVVSPTTITFTVQYQPTGTLRLDVTVFNTDALASAPIRLTITPLLSDATPIIFLEGEELDFEVFATIVHARVQKGSTAYLWFGGQVPHPFFGQIIDGILVASDDDGDGVVAFKQIDSSTGFAVFFVADSSGHRSWTRGPLSTPLPDATTSAPSVELGPDGTTSRVVTNGITDPMFLWIRPGAGAWWSEVFDGSSLDADVPFPNNHENTMTSVFHTVGAAPVPASFQSSDVLILLDPFTGAWWSGDLPSPLTGTPGNGTIHVISDGASEGGSLVVYLERRGGAGGAISTGYQTVDGTAIGGVNYVTSSGTVTFAPGEFLKTISIPTIADGIYDNSPRSFSIELTPQGTSVDGGNTLHLNVFNADKPPVLSIGDVRVDEGDTGNRTVTVPVTLSGATRLAANVFWDASDGSRGGFQFAVGETSKTVSITYTANTSIEPDRVITITLHDPSNATVFKATGTVTIADDDSPKLSVNDINVDERIGTAFFTISLARAATSAVAVHYSTADLTATTPLDYGSASGTLTLAPGEVTKSVAVTIVNDALAEENETFSLTLSQPSGGAVIAKAIGIATIVDAGSAPLPVVLIPDVLVTEGNSGTATATFEVTLSLPSLATVSVSWETEDGSADGADYVAGSGTLVFAPGETSKSITVQVVGDTLPESNEVFYLKVTSAAGAIPGNGAACTILDDDHGPVVPPRRRSARH